MESIYDTEFYEVLLNREDPEGMWYWVVNKEYGLAETKEGIKPQALLFCEQFNILLKQGTHKEVARNMVQNIAEESLQVYAYGDEFKH